MLGKSGKIDLPMLFSNLSQQFGIASILIEGGGILMQEVIEQQLLDEMHFFIAPILIGQGIQSFGGYSAENLETAYRLTSKGVLKSGTDLHVITVKSA